MPWIKFARDYDWQPRPGNPNPTVAYKAGATVFVKAACAEAAIAAGAAVKTSKPRGDDTESDDNAGG